MLRRKFQIQQNYTIIFDRTQKYSTQEACLKELNQYRWKNGFICPRCGHDKSYQLKHRHLHECTKCGCKVSLTADAVFEPTRLPLSKWFATFYLMGTDNAGIFAQRFSKMIGVFWPSFYQMLRNLCQAMGDRDCVYRFKGLVEVDNAFVGGRKPSKRDPSAEEKKSVIFAVEQRVNGMGLMEVRIVGRVNSLLIQEFSRRISPESQVRTDAFCGFWVNRTGTKPRPPRRRKWMNGFPRFILSPAISRVFWQALSTGYRIDTFRNIMTSLCSPSIADSGNLSYRIDC